MTEEAKKIYENNMKYVKKLRALVPKDVILTGEEPLKEVEGWISVGSIVFNYTDLSGGDPVPQYSYIFVSDEITLDNCAMMGMGRSIYKPRVYTNFKILGAVDE